MRPPRSAVQKRYSIADIAVLVYAVFWLLWHRRERGLEDAFYAAFGRAYLERPPDQS